MHQYLDNRLLQSINELRGRLPNSKRIDYAEQFVGWFNVYHAPLLDELGDDYLVLYRIYAEHVRFVLGVEMPDEIDLSEAARVASELPE